MIGMHIAFYADDDNDDNDHTEDDHNDDDDDDDDDDDLQMGSTTCQMACKEMGFDDGNTHWILWCWYNHDDNDDNDDDDHDDDDEDDNDDDDVAQSRSVYSLTLLLSHSKRSS